MFWNKKEKEMTEMEERRSEIHSFMIHLKDEVGVIALKLLEDPSDELRDLYERAHIFLDSEKAWETVDDAERFIEKYGQEIMKTVSSRTVREVD